MPSNFFKLSIFVFALFATSAVILFNGQLFRPSASEIVRLPDRATPSSTYTSTSPDVPTVIGSDHYNFEQSPSTIPTMIVDPGYTPPVSNPPSPIILSPDPGYSAPVPSPIVSQAATPSASPSSGLSTPSPSPSPTCKPYGTWWNRYFRLPNCPWPSPSSHLPSVRPSASLTLPSPIVDESPAVTPSPIACASSKITISRPWWAFWLPKVTTKYGKCPKPSPSTNVSPSAKPSPKPTLSPKPASDIIRLYIDLGLKSRHDDINFTNKRAILYWYSTGKGERKISVSSSRAQRDSSGYWYVDFTPSDLGEKEIPSATYCAEIAYSFKNGSATGNQFPATTYVTYSDREITYGQSGVFSYDTKRYGLFETTGLEFREPTASKRIFCPTNNPSY